MDIVERAEWGAREGRGAARLDLDVLRGVAVHYTASHADMGVEHDRCPERVRAVQNYHLDRRRWLDIAYNWLVCRHGTVYEGRGWGRRSAANGTDAGNDHYHAVCFLGTDRDGRDDVQPHGRRALFDVIEEGRRRYPHAWETRPHSDFKATGCPGNEIRAWMGAGLPVDEEGRRPDDMPDDMVVVNARPVDIEECATGGYWVVCEDGGVFNFGGAPFLGSLGGVQLNAPVVEIVGTGSGSGYRLFAADGGVFPFGDALFKGSLGDMRLNAPVVAAAAPPDAMVGYWMLGEDGGVFGFGNVAYGGRIVYRAR